MLVGFLSSFCVSASDRYRRRSAGGRRKWHPFQLPQHNGRFAANTTYL